MFNLNILDYIYIAVVILSTLWATVRGGIYEMIATLSWVVAAITARFVSPVLDSVLQKWFDSPIATLVASYFIVFFVILVVVSFINQKLRDKIQDSILSVTDKTLGVIFGIIRGVVAMGFVYWGLLWYYNPRPLPDWAAQSSLRPIMQITAEDLDKWFVSGGKNTLIQRDMRGAEEAKKIHDNLINLAIEKKSNNAGTADETGYKPSEQEAMQKKLSQIESMANMSSEN